MPCGATRWIAESWEKGGRCPDEDLFIWLSTDQAPGPSTSLSGGGGPDPGALIFSFSVVRFRKSVG